MPEPQERERAEQPEDLGRLLLERANARDVEGVVALYDAQAVLKLPDGGVATGSEQIRQVYARLLVDGGPVFAGEVQPAVRYGGIALTSTRITGGATAEVARRSADGYWLWLIDDPNVVV